MAIVVYLRPTYNISIKRLMKLLDELFSLSITEGAICDVLARAREPSLDAATVIETVIFAGSVISSDDTSARVKARPGRNACSSRPSSRCM